MSVNTKIYILTYEDKILKNTIELENFKFMRFDSGIYDTVWDSIGNKGSSEIFKYYSENYKLTNKEYELLQFYNFGCEDILEQNNEESESINNFKKIPVDIITPPIVLKEILERIIKIESKKLNEVVNKRIEELKENDELDQVKINLFNIHKSKTKFNKIYTNALNSIHYCINRNKSNSFLKLAIYLLGILEVISLNENIEIQIVFYQE